MILTTFKSTLVVFLLGLLVSTAVAVEELSRLKLTGTVVGAAGMRIAVVEMTAGKQRIIREGDLLYGARVLHIGRDWISLRTQDGDRELPLTSGTIVGHGSSAEQTPPVTVSRKLSEDGILRIQEWQQQADSVDGEALTTKIQRLLELPANSVLTSVNWQPVESIEQGIEAVTDALRRGELQKLTANSPDGEIEVYIEYPDTGNEPKTE